MGMPAFEPREGRGEIIRLDQVRQALATCQEPEEALTLYEVMDGMGRSREHAERYARMSGLEAMEVRRQALEHALLAARRVGELLPPAEEAGGVPGRNTPPCELPLSRTQRHRFRRLAAIPLETFMEQLKEWAEAGREASKEGMLRHAPPPEARPVATADAARDLQRRAKRYEAAAARVREQARVGALREDEAWREAVEQEAELLAELAQVLRIAATPEGVRWGR